MFGTEGVLHCYLDQHGYSHGLQNITLANSGASRPKQNSFFTAWLISIRNISLAILILTYKVIFLSSA
jgi:hypothetical protein